MDRARCQISGGFHRERPNLLLTVVLWIARELCIVQHRRVRQPDKEVRI
jgi:hypothetical protein